VEVLLDQEVHTALTELRNMVERELKTASMIHSVIEHLPRG
jgi:hypothetical protein